MKELVTPANKTVIRGPVGVVKWIKCSYDRYKTVCYGTVRGCFILWRQTAEGGFEELWAHKLGKGLEILDIGASETIHNHVLIVIGTACGSVQLWRYDSNVMLNKVFSVQIEDTVPRSVTFTTSKTNSVNITVFGFYDGRMRAAFLSLSPNFTDMFCSYTLDCEGHHLQSHSYRTLV